MNRVCVAVAFLSSVLFLAGGAEAQSAPPLTNLQISALRSEQAPQWQGVRPDALATPDGRNGGRWFEVKVRATGYDDREARATFAGIRARVVSRTPVLDSWRNVVGFDYVFRVTTSRPLQNGRWAVTATSDIFPYRTFWDYLFVQ